MSASVYLVVVDELVIRPLRPTTRGLIVLAGKDTHRSRDGDIGRVIKIEVKFPIETSRRNRRVRQPVDVKSSSTSSRVRSPAEYPLTVRPSTAEVIGAAGWP